MATYTVEIQTCDDTGKSWQTVTVENADHDGTASELAWFVAGNQTAAEDSWRVRVWPGADATDYEPTPAPEAEVSATDALVAELASNRDKAAKLDERRDELVRVLMLAKPKVARERIAKAADLSVPRLYQVRDGRR